MESALSIKKPRFKILAPKPASTGRSSYDPPRPGNDNVRCISTCGDGKVELSNLKKCESEMSESRKHLVCDNGRKQQTKRKPEQSLVSPAQKRFKMDRSIFEKCYLVLRKLMNHKDAWPFIEPVDPVALKIPDYFSIISHPMDLGTIESKLKKKVYTEAEEFDADVRLTFSNAMRYNPPGNTYHQMAKKLNEMYNVQWRSLDAVPIRQSMKTELRGTLKEKKQSDSVGGRTAKLTCADVVLPHSSVGMPSSKVKALSSKDVPCRMDIEAQEPRENRTGDNKVSLLNRASGGTRAPRTAAQPMIKKPSEAKEYAKDVPVTPMSKQRKTLEKSDMEYIKEPLVNSGYPEFDSGARCLIEEPASAQCQVTSTSYSAPLEDCQNLSYGALLSPSKEQRAEMLKKRFAETISKAQQKTLLHMDIKFHSSKEQQEKERLEQRHRAERARIEAEMKASKIMLENKLRNQRQQEREAARMALEKMERSVEFADNVCILRELAMLIGDYSFAGPLRGCGGMYVAASKFANGKLKSPLERLGLFLKEDYASLDDFDEAENFQNGDYEEGELIA